MQVKITKREFLFLLMFLVISIALPLFAAEVNWPRSPTGFLFNPDTATIRDLVRYLYDWGIFLGGLVAFFALVIAGVGYLTSFGNPAAMQDARERIWSAILGLIFLLASWLILNTISPQFTTLPELRLNVGQLQSIADTEFREERLTRPPCDYAELFSEKEWKGTSTTIKVDEVVGQLPLVGWLVGRVRPIGFFPLSVRKWRTLSEKELEEIKKQLMATDPTWDTPEKVPPDKIEEALKKMYSYVPTESVRRRNGRWEVVDGDCTLQLHAGRFFGWGGCGERKAEVSAIHGDLSLWLDAEIMCWKLVSPGGGKVK